jgi:hypothetical protein
VVLVLACLASAAAGAFGGRWPAIAAALDPALPGSVPDLRGLLLLGTALAASLRLGGRAAGLAHLRVATLTPLALLLADATSAAARLAAVTGGKPIAGAAVAGVALAQALALGLGRSPAGRRLGRAVGARLLVWGSAAAALDLLGSAVGSRGLGAAAGHGVAVAEEAMELLLCSGISAELVGALTKTDHAGREGPNLVPDARTPAPLSRWARALARSPSGGRCF